MSDMSQRKRLSAKRLECHLQETRGFKKPNIDLEQYVTPPHIAAQMLHFIDSKYNDLHGKFVADLGCGTGRLSVGCILCGATQVTGYDIDRKALDMALDNVDFILGPHKITCTHRDDSEEGKANLPLRVYQHCKKVNFVCADITDMSSCDDDTPLGSTDKKFDTVIMNPPFGTKNNQGMDMVFLKQAIRMSAGSVYSLHKTSTRDYISKTTREWGVKAKPIAQIRYNLDYSYKFHKKPTVDVEVDLWRIRCSPSLS